MRYSEYIETKKIKKKKKKKKKKMEKEKNKQSANTTISLRNICTPISISYVHIDLDI